MARSTLLQRWRGKFDPPKRTGFSASEELQRCLNGIDLMFLSIGSMVGGGVYVATGSVAREAGPSVIISCALAGIASMLSALCYAEIGTRFSSSGASYQAVYILLGEMWAFVVGWNNVISHAICTTIAAALTISYVDHLLGCKLSNFFQAHLPLFKGDYFASYVDLLSVAVVIAVFVLVGIGIKFSSLAIISFQSVNFAVVTFIIGSAFHFGKKSNWTNKEIGGFFPNGFSATVSGAATLIFTFTGYEVIAAVAEEVIEPKRNIPMSLFVSFAVTIFLYVSQSAAYISIRPWYNGTLFAPYSTAYSALGWNWAQYIIITGVLSATITSLLGGASALPRYVFAMARDGLIMNFLSKVSETSKMPIYATVFGALLCTILAMFFNLGSLINLLSLTQLVACIFVAISVVTVRYKPNQLLLRPIYERVNLEEPSTSRDTTVASLNSRREHNLYQNDSNKNVTIIAGKLQLDLKDTDFEWLSHWTDCFEPGSLPLTLFYIAIALSAIALIMLFYGGDRILKWWFVALLIVFLFLAILMLILMMLFKQESATKSFKVPFVPLFPFISILINFTLMMKLNALTWVRFGICLGIGFFLYFAYGFHNSKLRNNDD